MSERNEEILQEVTQKLDQLVTTYEMCLEANTMLSKEIEEIRMRLEKRSAEYETLKNRFETLQVSKSLVETKESKNDARKTIDSIVREVEQCIALLNR